MAEYTYCDNVTIIRTLYLEAGYTKCKIWFAGNRVDSYLVQSASLQQSGSVHIPVKVNGVTTFYIPTNGRWSDYAPITSFTLPGDVSFITVVKGEVPTLIGSGISLIGERNFSQLPTPPISRTGSLRGALIGDKFYTGCGQDENYAYRNDFWEYDVFTGAWTQKQHYGNTATEPDSSQRRVYPTCATDGTYVYAGGGRGPSNAYKTDWRRYNPATDTWTTLTGPVGTSGFNQLCSVWYGEGDPKNVYYWELRAYGNACLGNDIYVAYQRHYVVSGSPQQYFNGLMKYSVSTGLWTVLVPLGEYVNISHLFLSPDKKYLYALTIGENCGMYRYEIATNTWVNLNSYIQAVNWFWGIAQLIAGIDTIEAISTGTITVTDNSLVNAGETITITETNPVTGQISEVVYTFVNSLSSGAPNIIVIGSTATLTATNIAAVINATYGAEFVVTVANNIVTVTKYSSDTVVVTDTSDGITESAFTESIVYTSKIYFISYSNVSPNDMQVCCYDLISMVWSVVQTVPAPAYVSQGYYFKKDEFIYFGGQDDQDVGVFYKYLTDARTSATAILPALTGQGSTIDHGIFGNNYGLSTLPRFTGTGTAIDTSNIGFSFFPAFAGYAYSHALYPKTIDESLGTADSISAIRTLNPLLTDSMFLYEKLLAGWQLTNNETLNFTDDYSIILGLVISDWLTLIDTQTNNWNGTEAVSDSFYVVDISKVIQVYTDLIEDGMAVADAVNLALQLIITDILTCTDTVLNIGIFQHSIEDGMTLADAVRRFFPKSISDSFAATDASLVDFLALLQIADSINITEVTTPGLTINQVIADTLEVLDTVALQQFLQELIQDGLNIEVLIELDGEVYECWALSTSAFHVSVYSNYEYNSFALFNDTVYGCKSDGIYELAGDTDNGTAIHSGIILPKTNFGLAHNKRFRKAYFGVSGDNLVMKMETESGYRTFTMVDMEMSITRDLKGRSWRLSLAEFDSLDFIELIPTLLSRK